MNGKCEQQQIKRFLAWRKFEPVGDYPETPQPQNDLQIMPCETARMYHGEIVHTYNRMEAQIGN